MRKQHGDGGHREQVPRTGEQPRRADGDRKVRDEPRGVGRAQALGTEREQRKRAEVPDEVRQPQPEEQLVILAEVLYETLPFEGVIFGTSCIVFPTTRVPLLEGRLILVI